MWTRAMKGGVQRGRHCHGAGAHSETNVWRAERCEERCRESGVERSGERCGGRCGREAGREVFNRGSKIRVKRRRCEDVRGGSLERR